MQSFKMGLAATESSLPSPSSPSWPHRMEVVNHEGVARSNLAAMLAHNVRMIERQVIMAMLDRIGIGRVPDPSCQQDANPGKRSERAESRRLSRPRA